MKIGTHKIAVAALVISILTLIFSCCILAVIGFNLVNTQIRMEELGGSSILGGWLD